MLLSVKLRRIYSETFCIAFGASGSTVCESLADETKQFVLTVVQGDDVVARLSEHSIMRLKNEILEVIFIC